MLERDEESLIKEFLPTVEIEFWKACNIAWTLDKLLRDKLGSDNCMHPIRAASEAAEWITRIKTVRVRLVGYYDRVACADSIDDPYKGRGWYKKHGKSTTVQQVVEVHKV